MRIRRNSTYLGSANHWTDGACIGKCLPLGFQMLASGSEIVALEFRLEQPTRIEPQKGKPAGTDGDSSDAETQAVSSQ